ncbi:zinc finger protein SFP1 [Kluyveromyces marxianus]|nr:zinc finger protein SFP1 [Kluyveromyces marxianus]
MEITATTTTTTAAMPASTSAGNSRSNSGVIGGSVSHPGSVPGIFISDGQGQAQTQAQAQAQAQNQGQGQQGLAPQQMAKLRRDSIAHSQGIGGVSWGSLTISSWLRDEVMIHSQTYAKDHALSGSHNSKSFPINVGKHGSGAAAAGINVPNTAGTKSPLDLTKFASPPGSSGAYLPNLEKQYCKDYSCCGQLLPSLHDLLRHYEEAHIATSPGGHGHGHSHVIGNAHHHHNNNNNNNSINSHMHGQHQHQNHHSQQNHHQSGMVGVNMNFSLQTATNHSTSAGASPSNSANSHSNSNSAAAAANSGNQHSNLHSHLHQHNATMSPHSSHGNMRSEGKHDQFDPNSVSYQQQRIQQQQLGGADSQNHGMGSRRLDPRSQQINNNLSQSKVPQRSQLNNSSSNASLSTLSQTVQASASTGQIHLNGGFVDAVSTNEVFLQSKHNQPSSTRNISNFNSYSTKSHQTMSQPAAKRSLPLGTGLDLDYMETGVMGGLHENSLGGVMGFGSMDSISHTVPLTNANQHGLQKKSKKLANAHLKSKGLGRQDSGSGLLVDHGSGVVVDDDVDDAVDDDDDDDDDDDNVSSNRKQQGYIDDPARRLYVMDHEEHKPFKCPVIGCDKTYKNQNGLKYHKLHGHQNQKLHENPDGTFSIIDPESNEPYPDGMGMENDKPYRCEVCGKRYKNLNGLKYHRGHSTH